MKVKVTVTKLTDTSKGQISGGTHFVEEDIAAELVAGGHATIAESAADPAKPAAPSEPPFLPTKTTKGDKPKAVAPKPAKTESKSEDKN